MRPWALAVSVAAVAAASCGGSSSSESPGSGSLVGTERLGWDQPAADAAELSTFRFVVYVDNVRQLLTGVNCAPDLLPAGFACTSALPTMTPGVHVLEIASYRVENPSLESPRSLPLTVNFSGRVTTGLPPETPQPVADTVPDTQSVRTTAGATLRADVTLRGLEGVTALAFAPDGVLFVGDRFGRVLRAEPGGGVSEALTIQDAVTTANGGGVLALALDPNFAQTRHVFIVDAVGARTGLEFRLSRYREAGGRLGERAVLLGRVAASSEPSAAVAAAADGRLLVAFDAGDGAGGYSGGFLRLNADGTTPPEQRAASPLILSSLSAPRSLAAESPDAWWLADPGRRALERILIHRRTGVQRQTVRLADGSEPRAVAVATPDATAGLDRPVLVIATDGDTPLLLADPESSSTALAGEPLALEGVARVDAIAVGPDGAVYFATGRSLVRLAVR